MCIEQNCRTGIDLASKVEKFNKEKAVLQATGHIISLV